MIAELTGRRRLFSPRRLINEIVRWILGIYSPTGTIRIGNTAHPGEDRSMSLDVDIGTVAGRVAERVGNRPFTADQRNEVCDVVRSHVDDVSLVWRDGGLAVNEEWVAEQIPEQQSVPSDEIGTPVSAGSFPTNEVTQAASTLWTAGGANGATLLLLYKGTYNANTGIHGTYVAKLTVSKDGLITKIEAVQNGGMEIGA